MGRSVRSGSMVRGVVMFLLAFTVFSCSTEQEEPTSEEARPAPEAAPREVTKVVTVAEAPKPAREAPPTRQAPAPSSSEAAPPAAPPEASSAQAESPEDVLALQYRLINAGDYEGAYALFAGQSKQIVSPDQYRAYFESNAPYSITDYSFPSVDVQGDTASVEAALTVNSASGQETYQGAQQLVNENGAWRVVMRDEQASAFVAGAEEFAQYTQESTSEVGAVLPPEVASGTSPSRVPSEEGPMPEPGTEPEADDEEQILTPDGREPFTEPSSDLVPSPETTLSTPSEVPPQYGTTSATPSAQEDVYDCPDFDFQEDAQAVYDTDPSDPYGLDGPPGESFTGVEGVACEDLPSRGEVTGGTTEPEQYE